MAMLGPLYFPKCYKVLFICLSIDLFIYLFRQKERERQKELGGAEGRRESQAGSTLLAWSPTHGSISQTMSL